jgi:hypothetical protein
MHRRTHKGRVRTKEEVGEKPVDSGCVSNVEWEGLMMGRIRGVTKRKLGC